MSGVRLSISGAVWEDNDFVGHPRSIGSGFVADLDAAACTSGLVARHAALLYREALELVPEEDTEQRSLLRRRLALASTAPFHVADVRRPGSPQA